MTSGILQDSLPVTGAPPASSPRFRPYASPNHHVIKSRYITSNDPRGYIPVYEYPLNGQWIMMDVDDGYILWTGIWKALGNSKADIVKMIESQPDLASQIRRVRGGYLKIQGTWMPYEVALRLSRRVAWPIRHDLVPLFGPTFPTTCLSPEQPGFGQVIANGSGRRRTRRSNHVQTPGMVPTGSSGPQAGWTIISGPSYPHEIRQSSPQFSHQITSPFTNPSAWSAQHQKIESTPSPTDTLSIDGGVDRLSLTRERSHNARYSPYPGTSGPTNGSFTSNVSSPVGPSRHSFSDASGFAGSRRVSTQEDRIKLPPLQPPTTARASGQAPISLPPISSWAASSPFTDSRAVLQRLRASDATDLPKFLPSPEEQLNHRRRSSSAPSNAQPFDFEPPRSLNTSIGGETHHWSSERSRSRDSPRLQTLVVHRRPSDSSSAVTSPSTSFLLSTPDGVSPSDPSPVLPLTPHTSAPLPREPHDSLPSSMKDLSGNNNRTAIRSHTYTDAPRPGFGYDRDRPQSYGRRGGAEAFPLPPLKTEASPMFHESAKLWDQYSANYASSQPVRPW